MKRLASVLVVSLLALAHPAAAGWAPTAAMKAGRAEHVLVVLPTGKVLAAGGSTVDYPSVAATNTAELYDPTTGQWTDTEPMEVPRTRAAAALLANGTVLVAGGATTGNDGLSTSQTYDPGTGKWTARGPLGGNRVWAALVPSGDGALLIGGKTTNYFGQDATTLVEAYGADGKWKALKPLLKARYGNFVALALADGRVLVAGGFEGGNANDVTLAEAELYDPKTGEWTVTGSLNVSRATGYAVRLADGNVLVAGGASHPSAALVAEATFTAEVYDVGTGKWSPVGPLRGVPGKVSTTYRLNPGPLLPSGDTLAILGLGAGGPIAERYVARTRQWEQTCATDGMTFYDWGAVLLPGGKVLLTGGTTNSTSPASQAAYVLTPDGPGCACNADCTGAGAPYCRPAEGQDAGPGAGACVACLTDEHCAAGSRCLGGACAAPTPDGGVADAAGGVADAAGAAVDAGPGSDAAVTVDAATRDAPTASPDAPAPWSDGSGMNNRQGGDSGCGCRTGGASRPSPRWMGLVLAGALWLRRRGRSGRSGSAPRRA